MIHYLETHFVAKDILKLYGRNTPLINLNIVLYYDFSLNMYECLKYHHQYYHKQLENHRYIHII